MSGSPHTEEPSVTSGEPNPVVYPTVTSPQTTTADSPIPAVSGPSLPPAVVNDSLLASIPPRYGDQAPPPAFTRSPIQHQHQHHHHHHRHQHQQQLELQHHHPGAPSYPLSTLESTVTGSSNRSLAQKSTRRTKAHVASACVNCKKKHLGCDPARPCRRCVLAGKASSCVDVTHKKRGRPPLKAEDSSLRSYTTHMENPNVSVEAQSSSMAAQRTVLHRATSSRELRPMTDLQAMGEPSPTAATMRMPRNQPHRWSASVFPLTRPMDPSPPMPGNAGRRPFSSSGPASYAAVPPHPPPAFIPMTSGFNPVLNPSAVPPGMDRRYPPYGGPALPPPTSPLQHQPGGTPYLPYTESPASTVHQPMSDPRMPPGPREPYLESPVRLPPIHQATASPVSYHAHRLSDPYPATWMNSSSSREENREPRSPVTLQRPVGSLFSHTTPRQHQRSISSTGPLDPIPRHLGPIDLPSSVPLGHSPPIPVQQHAPSSTEAEIGESRPIKRRRMALDDMVNG
ncbi:hypothetical protein N7481_005062 [Penicillium waksmanii]|uniref:uncharacterized protein n=1 Tax=Penicillium waksmanii TaxID=69791 RepID=UPI0025480081|nr:uncharacterized protein N7481_005062 [Penicillium waksmanii]KAJ5982963.1 hypothetical protein N7481_005062 [Penicillium waksmanii]